MWPFRSSLPDGFEALANRVEKLEIDNAQRQVEVLNTCERVLYQLGARERARAKKDTTDDATEPGESTVEERQANPLLAIRRKLRGF
ncbi:MAG TPA: hypothetical protein VK647_15570 [Gemmatimonadales bacterium]|nr:hypothetical protein [Gemmatimonadales bacterium]